MKYKSFFGAVSAPVCCCLCPAFLQDDTRGRSGQYWFAAEAAPWFLGVACALRWAPSSCLQLRAATAAHATLESVRAPGILVSFKVSRACVLCRRHAEGAACCGQIAKSPTCSARAALLARPSTARANSKGDEDQAQACASFLEAFRRAAFLLLCEMHRKRRLCVPAAPRSLDHLTSGQCRRATWYV